MKLNLTLNHKMIITLFSSLLIIFLSQLMVRTMIELPALIELETLSDGKDIQRVKRAIENRVFQHELAAYDYAIWNDSYEFVTLSSSDPRFLKYIENNLVDSSFASLNVGGVLILDKSNKTIFTTRYDFITKTTQTKNQVIFDNLLERALRQTTDNNFGTTINAGIINTNIGPVIFAASKILPSSNPLLESRGTFILWTQLDEIAFDQLSSSLELQLKSISIDFLSQEVEYFTYFKQLMVKGVEFLPRNTSDYLYWTINDKSEDPILLIQQKTNKRTFNDSFLSSSLITGFSVSGLILIIISIFFSRNIISRLTSARSLMTDIIETGDFNRFLNVRGKDQIDQMFSKFNQLLFYINEQDKALKEQNLHLEQLNLEDPLTGVGNRRNLDTVLEQSWRQCKRFRKPISILMIDIDSFKKYNDHYGHQSGDTVLIKIAQTLQSKIHRATDYFARYGGEEFIVVLMDTDKTHAVSLANKLCQSISSLKLEHDTSSCSDIVTISVGVACTIPNDDQTALELINKADQALYNAKETGRNRACFIG